MSPNGRDGDLDDEECENELEREIEELRAELQAALVHAQLDAKPKVVGGVVVDIYPGTYTSVYDYVLSGATKREVSAKRGRSSHFHGVYSLYFIRCFLQEIEKCS